MFRWMAARARRWRMKTLKPFGRSSTSAVRLSLGDRSARVAQSLSDSFADVDAVEVVEGNLLDLDCDAIVSPANSFGDMSGGIDKAIDDFHGGRAQTAVRSAIIDRYLGELPVGVALLVELGGPRLPSVVAAPTMRVPGDVRGTINAYLSMRAALVAVLLHNSSSGGTIRSLVIPGLCTGVGGMHGAEAAAQMRAAYDNVVGVTGNGWSLRCWLLTRCGGQGREHAKRLVGSPESGTFFLRFCPGCERVWSGSVWKRDGGGTRRGRWDRDVPRVGKLAARRRA
jgi:O-acetyl-ADP-ribose deacetylase (regulator of RNase III)